MDKKNQNRLKKRESDQKASKNPFLNFLQEFRRKNTGLANREVVSKAGEAWRKMNDKEKAPYYEKARSAPRNRKPRSRHRRRTYWRKKGDGREKSGSRSDSQTSDSR